MKKILILALATLLSAPLGAAQLYRWVDERGNVEWRDTPPPPTAKNVQQRPVTSSTIPATGMPFSVQQAVKNFPVTLWVTDCGDTCTRARAHLARRGVPYTERSPHADLEAFKKLSGGAMEVPLLFVGNRMLKGYLESDWDSALDGAGYPTTPAIGYKPPPKAVAPKQDAPAAQSAPAPDAGVGAAEAPPPPAGALPPGTLEVPVGLPPVPLPWK